MKRKITLLIAFLFGGIYIHAQTVNYWNKTLAVDESVFGNIISSKNITVSNSSKLTLNSFEGVRINGPFSIKQGSQMVIRTGVEAPTWILARMEEVYVWDAEVWGEFLSIDPPVSEWFTFKIEGTELSGQSGCSKFKGHLASEGSTLIFTGVLSNLVGCFPQIQNLEHLYVDFVRRATNMVMTDETLTLYVEDDIVLEFYHR